MKSKSASYPLNGMFDLFGARYYNLARWEAREHAIRMGEVPPDDTGIVNLKRDEEQLR